MSSLSNPRVVTPSQKRRAVSSRPTLPLPTEGRTTAMTRLAGTIDGVIGVDPPPRPLAAAATADGLDVVGGLLAQTSVSADAAGYRRLLDFARAARPVEGVIGEWQGAGVGGDQDRAGWTGPLSAMRSWSPDRSTPTTFQPRSSRLGMAMPVPQPRSRQVPGPGPTSRPRVSSAVVVTFSPPISRSYQSARPSQRGGAGHGGRIARSGG
jgi:hypothetical protein